VTDQPSEQSALPARFRKYESPASRYISVEGTRIHYRDEGQGPTLVLLHGVMASLHTWDAWVDALRDRYRILRIDLPGFGLSDELPPDGYTPAASTSRLDHLFSALGIERFHLAGNSLGGFLSWYYAATYPGRVDRLILISPIAYPQKLPFIINFVSLPIVGEIARWTSPRPFVERNVRMVYGDPSAMAPGVVARYYELLQRGRNRTAMVKTFRALRSYNDDPAIAAHVARVTAPTLIQWGAKDRWVPPALLERWKADIPGATIRIYPGTGHVAMEELPGETSRDAHEFLSSKSST